MSSIIQAFPLGRVIGSAAESLDSSSFFSVSYHAHRHHPPLMLPHQGVLVGHAIVADLADVPVLVRDAVGAVGREFQRVVVGAGALPFADQHGLGVGRVGDGCVGVFNCGLRDELPFAACLPGVFSTLALRRGATGMTSPAGMVHAATVTTPAARHATTTTATVSNVASRRARLSCWPRFPRRKSSRPTALLRVWPARRWRTVQTGNGIEGDSAQPITPQSSARIPTASACSNGQPFPMRAAMYPPANVQRRPVAS